MDCTTVQLGPEQTVVQGSQIDQTTVRINQTASTTISDTCLVELVKDASTKPSTVIQTGLSTLRTVEGTKIVISNITLEPGGGGSSDPCGTNSIQLSYNLDGTLASVNKDGQVTTMAYTGDQLTQINKPGCSYQLTYNPDGTLDEVVKL